MTRRTAFETGHARNPQVPYSPSVSIGNLVQIAGQGPLNLASGAIVSDEFVPQARRTFANVIEQLDAAGLSSDDVLMVRVYLVDPDDFTAMNTVMAEYFSAPFPARTTVFVGLGDGMQIEVDALAVRPDRDASRQH